MVNIPSQSRQRLIGIYLVSSRIFPSLSRLQPMETFSLVGLASHRASGNPPFFSKWLWCVNAFTTNRTEPKRLVCLRFRNNTFWCVDEKRCDVCVSVVMDFERGANTFFGLWNHAKRYWDVAYACAECRLYDDDACFRNFPLSSASVE